MSRKQKDLFWAGLIALLVCSTAIGIVRERTRNRRDSVQDPKATLQLAANRPRNLALQPEALKLSRRLGGRFASDRRQISTLMGTLAIGSDQKTVTVIRRQTGDGERVEITVTGSPGLLTWDTANGALSSGTPATGSDRVLIERLVLDSPDQFVFAQLRGSTYQTIALQARPAEAAGSDNYRGPVWDIVRIGEHGYGSLKLPQSQWRLYYLNAGTGLIDKVVSEEQGQTITAEIASWTTQGGETTPTHIAWKRGNQIVMDFSLTNLAFSAQ